MLVGSWWREEEVEEGKLGFSFLPPSALRGHHYLGKRLLFPPPSPSVQARLISPQMSGEEEELDAHLEKEEEEEEEWLWQRRGTTMYVTQSGEIILYHKGDKVGK